MTSAHPAARKPKSGASPVQGLAMLAGLLFLVLGASGLVPGVTVGDGPDRALYGVFAVSGPWTLIHLLTGAGAVFSTRSARWSGRFLVAAGAVYAVLGVAGLFPLPRAVSAALPMNTAGVCLALGLGTAMLVLGGGWLRRR